MLTSFMYPKVALRTKLHGKEPHVTNTAFRCSSFNYLLYLFCISVFSWRCWRCSEMPSPTSPNISGKISFLYIMKSFSRLLVLSSSSVNLYSYSYLTPKNRTDFNPTDCDRYLSHILSFRLPYSQRS